jgi:hypothetical protein
MCLTGLARRQTNPLRPGIPAWRHRLAVTFLVIVATPAGLAAAPSERRRPPQVPSEQHSAASPGRAIAEEMGKRGVTSCGGRIAQVTDFLRAGGTVAADMFLPPAPGDRHLASLSLAILDKSGTSVFGSASFSPQQKHGCDAVYDAITWWPKKCPDVASSLFAGAKPRGVLGRTVTVLDLGPNMSAFLMPTADGCIAIKKEVVAGQ